MGKINMLKSIRNTYRLTVASLKDFIHDQCYLRASALTFYTLLSIVPVLAVAIGVAKGFGLDVYLEARLMETFSQQKYVIASAISFAHSLLQHSKGGIIAGIGVILLLGTNFTLLGNIESSLNAIWKVAQPRSWTRKLSDYLATMILCPIFFIASSSLTLYLKASIINFALHPLFFGFSATYLVFLLKVIPFILSWILFSCIYVLMPNTRGKLVSRMLAGILAGTLFQIWQWIYINFQVEIFNYGAVYGTFAVLPLFLVWVQASWLIVLFGAELAAHFEEDHDIIFNRTNTRFISEKQSAVLILAYCMESFITGKTVTAKKIALELGLPISALLRILRSLIKEKLLIEVVSKDQIVSTYQPKRDLRLLTLAEVSIIWDKTTEIPVQDTYLVEKMLMSFSDFYQLINNSDVNLTLEEFVKAAAEEGANDGANTGASSSR